MKKFVWIALIVLAPSMGFASVKTYQIDKDHSIVSFKIGHLIGKVQGSFQDFNGEIELDENKPKKFKTEATIDVNSIDTNNDKRDNHLRNPDFFDINNPKFPEYKTINFEAKNFQVQESKNGVHKGKLNGYITIHGIKQPISLDMQVNGKPIMDPFGNARISISASGSLNRQDFGLNWKHPAGEIVVGDIVDITLEVQGVREIKGAKKTADKKESKEASSKKEASKE